MTEGVLVVVIVARVASNANTVAEKLVIKHLIVLKIVDEIGIRVVHLKAVPARELEDIVGVLHRPGGMIEGNEITVIGRGLDILVYVLHRILAGLLRAYAIEDRRIALVILAIDLVVANVFVIILLACKKRKVNLGQEAVALRLFVGTDIRLVARQKQKFVVGQIIVGAGEAMVGDSKHLISRIFISFLKLLGSQSAVRYRAVAMKICLELLFVFGYKYFNSHFLTFLIVL
jgi:hypothetical protein